MTISQREPVGHELGQEEPPAAPRFWIRRCNGANPGQLVGLLAATWQAQQPGVDGTIETGLVWRSRSTQNPLLDEREFTLTPATEAEALEWIRANHHDTTS